MKKKNMYHGSKQLRVLLVFKDGIVGSGGGMTGIGGGSHDGGIDGGGPGVNHASSLSIESSEK